MGLQLIWRHKLIYIVLTLCEHAYKVDCIDKSGIEPLPFWLSREQKMLVFFASFEAYEMAGFLNRREKGEVCLQGRDFDRTWARFEGHLTTFTHPWEGTNCFVPGFVFRKMLKSPTKVQPRPLELNTEQCVKDTHLFSLTCTVLCITLTGRCSLGTFHWTVVHPWQQK